jgi:hypothetical protein
LQKRLGELQNFDFPQGETDLEQLVLAVPAARRVWSLISEVKSAASQAGVIVDKYSAVGGDVKEATISGSVSGVAAQAMQLEVGLTVNNMGQLWKMMDALERSIPLVKVVSVKLDSGAAVLVVEGAWGGWSKVMSDVTMALPEYSATLNEVKNRLGDFGVVYTPLNINVGSGDGVVDPF